MAAQQVSKLTNINPEGDGRRFRYRATANGVTGKVDTTTPVTIKAEPYAANGRIGLVFRDASGSPIRYVLRDA